MLIEIHMLKNYPPVNLNRDDTGAPKSCLFGGVQRGRISSQCLKRSWRTSEAFQKLGSGGVRTRHMPELVAERLRALGVAEEYLAPAQRMLTGIANKDGKENDKGITSQIAFYGAEELDRIAARIKEAIEADGSLKAFQKRKTKDFDQLVKDAATNPITADIALFGRMVTSSCFADVDASMQVAHAISTHAMEEETDFFTAVDDILDDRDENGAGMMGDVDYNSCCYYEYASLDTDALRENLKNVEGREALMREIVPALLRAMAFSNPSGKQNTFAGQVLPDLVLVECKRDKIPLSYVNAFEEPVRTSERENGIVRESIKKLCAHVNDMDAAYELPVEHRLCFAPRYPQFKPERGNAVARFSELTQRCADWIGEVDRA